MATLIRFNQETDPEDASSAAYRRLNEYLRAHGIRDRARRSQIVRRLLRGTRQRNGSGASDSPLRLAVTEAEQEMAKWFNKVLALEDVTPARAVRRGRVCFQLAGAPVRWPHVLLAMGEVPKDFVAEMRRVSLISSPDLDVSSMTPRPLDQPDPATILEDTWDSLLRMAGVSFLAVAAIVGFAWWVL